MTAVERVKAICKERHIAISRLEKDCGFGNGYIAQLRKGTFPADRLQKIASYLGVTSQYLLTGVEAEDDALEIREMLRDRPELRILFDASKDAPASSLLEAAALLLRFKEESESK